MRGDASRALDALRNAPTMFFVVFAASSKTSTIPGITAAGPTPEATLYTPTLDIEYLVTGRPLTMDVIPVTPEGIPTPAVVTRASLQLVNDARIVVVDAGVYREPLIPHVKLPSRRVGGRIDVEPALPPGTASKLYEEAKLLAHMLVGKAGNATTLVVGETIPAGTTTAMCIMEGLGFNAAGRVSSSMPGNPHNLKQQVLRAALERSGLRRGDNPFKVIEEVGDPLHVSVAGFVAGAVEKGATVILAGGTQMASVLAILSRLGIDTSRVAVATTRWLIDDPSSDLPGLIAEIAPDTPLIAVDISFHDAPYKGLRAYEEGYVKEGVGMGGAMLAALVRGGRAPREVVEAAYSEYARLVGNDSKARG
ncbi:Nicotinate-nucleotide-dimethylbenzimidazolephosp horibosyltransferase [Pyrolobus fumarii 1A]|uniref:UPF0284 protein Pyrfu_1348 n=1 Tax=Pyrolobus fumarii (strain DSM 11204 / 1A) TaxID=694429 RepID=G0EGQ8_PYRF1|nr:Nicotinate-nucleotide-dimethylbenzimidazolephosp horibosyltransferase [Pyrolobus fumarii 1A]